MNDTTTARAIYNLSGTGGQITYIGKTILRTLNDTGSMLALYNYLHDNQIFPQYDQYCERYPYYYQIPADSWKETTGLAVNSFFRVTMKDGSLFTDSNGYMLMTLTGKPASMVKQNILEIIGRTRSVKALIAYLRENGIFSDYRDLRIPLSNWVVTTGITPDEIHFETDDGAIRVVDPCVCLICE